MNVPQSIRVDYRTLLIGLFPNMGINHYSPIVRRIEEVSLVTVIKQSLNHAVQLPRCC